MAALSENVPIVVETGEEVESSPVVLVKCHGEGACGLVQIKHSVSVEQMYGDNYGYRSGLNRSMVEHLQGMSRFCTSTAKLAPGDLILDIGSNDGTLLRSYLDLQAQGNAVPQDITFVGMDPTIKKFKQFYDPRIVTIPDFFNAKGFFGQLQDSNRRAKIVTSIACFYDLENPVAFAKDLANGYTFFDISLVGCRGMAAENIDLAGELRRIEEYGCHILIQSDSLYPELLKQIYF